MFRLTIYVVWDIGMTDIFAVYVLLFDLLLHMYMEVDSTP